jgi:hypothetical protein
MALGLALLGCGNVESELNRQRAAAGSNHDAQSSVADGALGFSLSLPGEGWKLLDAAGAAALVPDAVAGAVHESGLVGVLRVELDAGLGLDERVRRRVLAMAELGAGLESSSDETYQGVAARRFVIVVPSVEPTGSAVRPSVEPTGQGLRYVGLAFDHAELDFELVTWTTAGADRAEVRDELFGALRLGAPGAGDASATHAVEPPDRDEGYAEAPPLEGDLQARGVGWQIEEDPRRFVSADSGLVVTPAEGFALLAGDALMRRHPEAEVGLSAQKPQLELWLSSEPAEVAVPVLDVPALWEPPSKAKPSGAFDARLFSGPLAMQRVSEGGMVELHGARVHRGRLVQVLARYRHEDEAKVRSRLQSALDGVDMLDDARKNDVARRLDEAGDPQDEVGPDETLRAGVWRHFGLGLSFRKPPGSWRLDTGAAARRWHPLATLFAEDRRLGLSALFLVDSPGSMHAAHFHDRALRSLSGRAEGTSDAPKATRLAGGAALSNLIAGAGMSYQLVTALRDERALTWVVWGKSAVVSAQAAEIERLQAAFEAMNAESITRTTDGYRDERLGFLMRAPAGWDFRDLTTPALRQRGTLVRWERDGRWFALLALDLGSHEQGAWRLRYLEQLTRERFGELARGAPAVATVAFGDGLARHLKWTATLERRDAMLLTRARRGFVLMAADRSDETFALAQKALELLP